MKVNFLASVTWLALASTASALLRSINLKSHLQVPSSFSGEGISLFPSLHPNHDATDLTHLTPDLSKELYYSQEGHRPAIHGAKHASVKVTFARPAVILDHSNQISNVQCTGDEIKVCFQSPQALKAAQNSWSPEMILLTYHAGCGDTTGMKRSFFHVSSPLFDYSSSCVTVSAVPIDEQDAFQEGEVNVGTYMAPGLRKREPVKGHVRLVDSTRALSNGMAHNGTAHNGTGRSATVDLTTDIWALRRFFNDSHLSAKGINNTINNLTFINPDGDVPPEKRHLSKRFLWLLFFIPQVREGVYNGFVSAAKAIASLFNIEPRVIDAAGKILAAIPDTVLQKLETQFKLRFTPTFHHDVAINKYIAGKYGTKASDITEKWEGFELTKDASATVECLKCGIKGDFSVAAQATFGIGSGITKLGASLVNHNPFIIDAIFGIEVEGKYEKDLLKKQIFAVPLGPIVIPGIFNLGPQVSFSAALNLELEGNIKLKVGGSLKVSQGKAYLGSLAESKKSTGLDATFTPVFEAKGSLSATADLGLPIALELGIDVLNGKFKQTIGLVDTPSVYLNATASRGVEGRKCDNGIELRAGIKNKIHFAASEYWEYNFREDILYEKGIGCVTVNGFDPNAVEKDQSVFKDITKKFGREKKLLAEENIPLNKVELKPNNPHPNQGFRIVVDAGKTNMLVSGTDGYLYLAKRTAENDLSAPWGSVNLEKGLLSFDTFGRVLAFDYRLFMRSLKGVAPLAVDFPQKMPDHYRATSLAILKNSKENYETYVVPIIFRETGVDEIEREKSVIFYPTACKTANGLRLVATKWPINQNGEARMNGDNGNYYMNNAFTRAGLKMQDCRTVRLASTVKGVGK